MSTWFNPTSSSSSLTNLGVTTTSGTWTPVMSGTGGVYASQTGTWAQTLNGSIRTVTVNAVFVVTTYPTSPAWTINSSNTIGPLPFTTIGTNQYVTACFDQTGAAWMVMGKLSSSGTTFTPYVSTGSISNGDRWTVSFTYQAV